MRRVLITGGNGYIGKSLFNNLKDEFDMTLINRDIVDLTDTDAVINFFKGKFFDTVINCASIGGSRLREDDISVIKNNILIFDNLKYCSDNFEKLINIGSGAELYHNLTPYGLSKYLINHSILLSSNCYNVRIFAVFDENELESRFIKLNIMDYINHIPIYIFDNKKMDFFYMKDFISIIKNHILGLINNKEIDCTYSETKTLYEIAAIINNLSDYKVDIITGSKTFSNYYGFYTPTDIEYIGLENGIKEVYKKLKQSKI